MHIDLFTAKVKENVRCVGESTTSKTCPREISRRGTTSKNHTYSVYMETDKTGKRQNEEGMNHHQLDSAHNQPMRKGNHVIA